MIDFEDFLSKLLNAPAYPVVRAIVDLGLASSASEAKRLISQGAVRINDQPITSSAAMIAILPNALIAVDKSTQGINIIR